MNEGFPSSTLVGVGFFGSVWMLVWASAAVVPLLIHLWNRRHHREAPWAAMEFLMAAVQEQSRRLRIEQLLLLLLRIAIPLVFALALADPLWQLLPSQGSSLGSREPHHHLFLVDTSYSMELLVDGQTRLQQSKELLRKIVEDSPQGDGFTLVRMASPSEAVVASPAYAKADILAELDGLSHQDQAADLSTALQIAKTTLEQTRLTNPRLKRHRIYVLSDLGRNTWGKVDRPEVRSLLGKIDELAELVTIDLSKSASETSVGNVSLVSANRSSVLPVRGSVVAWNLSAQNLSNLPANSSVEMRVDDQLVDKRTIDVRPSQSNSTTFEYRFDTAGQHAVSFRLQSDALRPDNERFEIVSVREQISVLCVEGRTGAARNIALAIAPKDDEQIRVRTIRDHRLGETSLENYDTIFLCNPGSLTKQDATALRDFVRLGRSVVVFLGDQSQPRNLNDLLGRGLKASGEEGSVPLLPTDIIETSDYATHRLSPKEYLHPLMRVFRGQEDSGLLNTPIWVYTKLERPSSEQGTGQARVALEFDNGDPLIIEHTALGGNVTVIATSPSQLSVVKRNGRDTPWNAFSVWPSFPPIVQELLTFAISQSEQRTNLRVGQPLVGVFSSQSSVEFVSLSDPFGVEQRIAVEQDLSLPAWSSPIAKRSGIYSARHGTEPDELQQFAVNIADYRESRLDALSVEDLPSQLQQHSIDVESVETTRVESAPLFRQILGLLLVLLVTETVVAWYFGNAKA